MKEKEQTSGRPALFLLAFSAGVACILGFFGFRWLTSGRVEYWTGPTERHHVLATPDSYPITYWVLVSVFCMGALVLIAKCAAALIARLRCEAANQNLAE